MKTYREAMDEITTSATLLERTEKAMATETRRIRPPHKNKRFIRAVLASAAAVALIVFSTVAVSLLHAEPRVLTPLSDDHFAQRVELSDGLLVFEAASDDTLTMPNYFGSVEAAGEPSTKEGCGLPIAALALRDAGVPLLEEHYWVGSAVLCYGGNGRSILFRISLNGESVEKATSQISGIPLRLEYDASSNTYAAYYKNGDDCYCEVKATDLTQRELVSLLLKNIS